MLNSEARSTRSVPQGRIEDSLIEFRRALKSEYLRRVVPSPREVFNCPPALPGTLEMDGQDLGIRLACTLESQGDVSMAIRQGSLW